MSVGGGTPRAEAILEERRRVLRNALKAEFIKKKYNPNTYNQGGHIFDASVQRWHALQFTYGDHFKPTFTNFMKFFVMGPLPIIAYYNLCWGSHHNEWLRSVARGEVAYDAQSRKANFWAS